jgi:hypothetical protein
VGSHYFGHVWRTPHILVTWVWCSGHFLLARRLAPQRLTFLPENSLFVFSFSDAPSNDPLIPATNGQVRDTQSISGARSSGRELIPFLRIAPKSFPIGRWPAKWLDRGRIYRTYDGTARLAVTCHPLATARYQNAATSTPLPRAARRNTSAPVQSPRTHARQSSGPYRRAA